MLKRTLSICVFVIFLNVCANADNVRQISPADKAILIQKVMEIRLKTEGPEKFSDYLIISTDNMSSTLLPKIDGYQFTLMKPKEIQKRQKKADRFRYLRVNEPKLQGRVVILWLGVIERCGGLPCHSHSYQYVFEKIDGEWQGQIRMVIC